MGYVKKTISYFKRNGIADTTKAVFERIDKSGMDPAQKKANAYRKRMTKVCRDRMESEQICFSIVVPAYETRELFLRQLMDSVLEQTYHNLQLVIADASATEQVAEVVKTYQDERIVYHKLSKNSGISDNTNEALMQASGDYIGLLDHDDILEPDALYHIAKKILTDDCDMVYTDEDKMASDGLSFFEPNFKPDFNFDYLLTNNYICHFTVIRASIIKELQFRSRYDGAQDYDLFLRVVRLVWENKEENTDFDEPDEMYEASYMKKKIGHIPEVLYHWRAHELSTADNPESKRYAYEAGKACLEEFLSLHNWECEVSHGAHLGFYEVNYLPDIFSVRKDIVAIGTYETRMGKVIRGPYLDGSECFLHMNKAYSGYLHRAALSFDAKRLPEKRTIWREGGIQGDHKKKQGKYLYLSPEQYKLYQSAKETVK